MKPKQSVEGQPTFWVKLIGVLVAVSIVAVLVFAGVQNVIEQMTELQRDLDVKSSELQLVSDQLAAATSELESTASELNQSQVELDAKDNELAQVNRELEAIGAELADITAEKAETDRRLSEKTSELASGQNKLSALSNELDMAKSDMVSLRRELAEVQTELTQANADLEANAEERNATRSELAAKVIELETVQDQLAVAVDELNGLRGELAESRLELELATIIVTESHTDLYAFNWGYQIAACVLNETRDYAAFMVGENREYSSEESARYFIYQAFIMGQEMAASPLREYCILEGFDNTTLEIWWERAYVRVEDEIGLDWEEAKKAFEPFGGILVPHSTIISYADEILAEMSATVGEWSSVITDSVVSRLWFDPS